MSKTTDADRKMASAVARYNRAQRAQSFSQVQLRLGAAVLDRLREISLATGRSVQDLLREGAAHVATKHGEHVALREAHTAKRPSKARTKSDVRNSQSADGA